jgi:hypothetical protein
MVTENVWVRDYDIGHGVGGVIGRADGPLVDASLVSWRRCEGLL